MRKKIDLCTRAAVCTSFVFLFFTTAVKAQTITVMNLNGLSFGTIVAGDQAFVTPQDPGAAIFKITVDNRNQDNNGQNNSNKDSGNNNGNGPKRIHIQVSFALPTELLLDEYSIPVTFSSESAIWNKKNSIHGGTTFDPRQQITLVMKDDEGNNNDMYIYLGGDIQTSPGQHAGYYGATVVMTVTEVDD